MTLVICWCEDIQCWGAGFVEYVVRLSIAEKYLIKYILKTLKLKYDKCVSYRKAYAHANARTHKYRQLRKGLSLR